MGLADELEQLVTAAVERATAPLREALAQPPRLAYSAAEVAKLCGTSEHTVKRWVHAGQLAIVPGTENRMLIPRVSVEALMADTEAERVANLRPGFARPA